MNKNVKLYKDYSIALDTILRVNITSMLNIKNIRLRVLARLVLKHKIAYEGDFLSLCTVTF